MKSSATAIVASCAVFAAASADETASPVAKVLDLLGSLEAKIIKEGETAQKEYDEFTEYCEERNRNLDFEIKTGKAEKASLEATIEEETATATALTSKIEELAGSIATDDSDLKAATEIRVKEAADFAAEEKELSEVIDTLKRAVGILEREMAKGGASMMQLKSASSMAEALSTMVQASVISSADSKRLAALVQTAQDSEDDEDDMGAPAAAVYKGQSGGIIDTLEELLEKAEGQLDAARKKETTALHNFEMLKQSLEDSIKNSEKDMKASKKSLAESGEKKAVAQGDLSVTEEDLADDEKTKSTLHSDCLTKAEDFEASTKSRGEELKALAAAKKVIKETTAGADSLSYGLDQTSSSFLQVSKSSLSSAADLANFEAVRHVRDLAKKMKSPELAQLASRMSAAMRMANRNRNGSADPFAKVKGLIKDMIEKLESSAQADATQKAYCDKEMSESSEKKAENEVDVEKLTTKIDQMSSKSAQLKEETAALQKELAELAGSQAEMDKMRQEEKATFTSNSADMKQGLEGVKMALKLLREYYAQDKDHAAAEGSASGIVGLLEVVESDFSKGLAEMTATEESSASTYDAQSKENEITKVTKSKDVEYKTKESTGLDKAVSDAESDRAGVQAELDAVNEYLEKLKDMCIAKPETYSERKARRDAEIAGLKEALQILEGEAVLLQATSKRNMLRGVVTARVHAH